MHRRRVLSSARVLAAWCLTVSSQLLARLADHDAPIASLPLDFLCALLHQSLRAAVPSGPVWERRHSDVIYMRMSRADGPRRGANLVRTETVKLFNEDGQVTQVAACVTQGLLGVSVGPARGAGC